MKYLIKSKGSCLPSALLDAFRFSSGVEVGGLPGHHNCHHIPVQMQAGWASAGGRWLPIPVRPLVWSLLFLAGLGWGYARMQAQCGFGRFSNIAHFYFRFLPLYRCVQHSGVTMCRLHIGDLVRVREESGSKGAGVYAELANQKGIKCSS